ncbi:MAG: YqaJ viral recombinase family protein, partial [Candidatus Peribacteraceae bacterium]|nr:YqaJ viral recombinase family protein [Candidatus Peribacteraceae bacterium]
MNTRADWLRERKGLLTASDIAAILGEHPHKTNIDVYMDKITDDICQDDEDHLKFGRDVEGAIANLYETRTGNEVIDIGSTVISKHPDIDWIGATLDRKTVIDGVQVPLELKHVGGFVNMQEWQDEPPTHYQIQCQIQCACEKDEFSKLAGLFPGYQLGQKRLEYSQDFFDSIFPELDEF